MGSQTAGVLIGGLLAIAGVVLGSVFSLHQNRQRRKWDLTDQRLDAYASFLRRASSWQMLITEIARHPGHPPLGYDNVTPDSAVHTEHVATLDPFGRIRLLARDDVFQAARQVLAVCEEYEANYRNGRLSVLRTDLLKARTYGGRKARLLKAVEVEVLANDAAWQVARDRFITVLKH